VREHASERQATSRAPQRRTSDHDAIVRIAGDEGALAQQVLENIPGVVITILDREMRVVSIRRAAVVSGVRGDDILGRSILELFPPEQAAQLAREYGGALHGQERRFRFTRPDTRVTYDTVAGPLRDAAGQIIGVIVTARDISAQIAAEARVATQLERFLEAFEHAPLPMAVLNADGTLRVANGELRDLTGREQEGLAGRPFTAIIDPRDRERITELLSGLLDGTAPREKTEARMLVRGEPAVSCTFHLTPRDPNDPESGVTIQIVDQTEQRRHDAQLRYLTGHDTLTGLVNRARFEEAIEAHLENCARYGHDGAVILIDVDHFRQINDAHGRGTGDQQLIEVTGLLKRGLPESAVVGRLGGDEFGVLLAGGELDEAMRTAKKILLAAHDQANAARAAGRVTFTLSIGVAAVTTEVSAPADVLVLAEHAVTTAKHGGRDRIAAPELVTRPGERRSQTAIGRLRRAIRDERFELHAQPIVRLADDHVSQYELLVRMRDDDGELVAPDAFLPLAEHYGLIGEIDAWVARSAVAALAPLERDCCFQVNISGRSLGYPALLDGIADGLRQHRIAASRLVFELTETAAIANVPQALAFAERLRELGCQLALDDFGAGFGGLHYLKHLPFSYLKIDGEFIADVASNRTDQMIVEGILAITQGMKVKTVAEFVQDDACLDHLRRVGVDYAQGFHLGRPEPLDDVLAQLAADVERRSA
jgi:diguanylate cyclase (GGDEF)-like protein/PAS domain S-box-containing protein